MVVSVPLIGLNSIKFSDNIGDDDSDDGDADSDDDVYDGNTDNGEQSYKPPKDYICYSSRVGIAEGIRVYTIDIFKHNTKEKFTSQ